MRRLTRVFLAISMLLGIGTAALAADMPMKAPVAPVVAAPSRTGFYLGIAGGYGWGSTRHTNDANGANSGTNDDLNGGIVGLTYGYNWQSGPLVLGFEGDMSWSGIKDTYFDNGLGFCSVGPCVTNLNWLGTDRVRLGYAFDRYLVYATGGVAYGEVEATCCAAGVATREAKWRAGWTAGGGIEALLTPSWSAKLEYLYADLGDRTTYHLAGAGVGESVSVKTSIVRFGINYRFGGLP